jgi:hypothetical protein
VNRDLFLAILALDSYNRGYGRRIKAGSDAPTNTTGDIGIQLGNATIGADSAVLLDDNRNRTDIPSDFYAIAYDYNGETIISYRGTDNLLKDANSGYGLGGGDTSLVMTNAALNMVYDRVFGTDFWDYGDSVFNYYWVHPACGSYV